MSCPALSLRILTCDHYQNAPIKDLDETYSEFSGSEINNVPVIRIFGIMPTGKKVCLHVHGVFPYLSIPYKGDAGEPALRFVHQLALNIDKALNKNSKNQHRHIHKISLVSAVPFYGYHDKEQSFLRLYFYNPFVLKRAVELLHSGAVLDEFFQPHEAHISYIMQFFIDYNLFGMDFIQLGKVDFRQSVEQSELPIVSTPHLKGAASVMKMSTCEIEADCCATDILNRLQNNDINMNPGLVSLWKTERQRRLDLLDESKVAPSLSQDRCETVMTKTEQALQQKLNRIVNSLSLEQELTSSQISSSCKTSSDEQDSMISSGDLSEMLDSQDMDLVHLMMEDSILSTQKRSTETRDSESDDEVEMSQAIWDCGSGRLEEQKVNREPLPLPQLDGTFDDPQPTTSGLERDRGLTSGSNEQSYSSMDVRSPQPRNAEQSYNLHTLPVSSQFSTGNYLSSSQPLPVNSFYEVSNCNLWNSSSSSRTFGSYSVPQTEWQTQTFSTPLNDGEKSIGSISVLSSTVDYTLCVNEMRPPSLPQATNWHSESSPNCSNRSNDSYFFQKNHFPHSVSYSSDSLQSSPSPSKANPRTEFIRSLKRRKLSLHPEPTPKECTRPHDSFDWPVPAETQKSKKLSLGDNSSAMAPPRKPKKTYKRKRKLTLEEFYTELICELPGKALNVLLSNGVYIRKYVPTESLTGLGTERVALTRLKQSDCESDSENSSGSETEIDVSDESQSVHEASVMAQSSTVADNQWQKATESLDVVPKRGRPRRHLVGCSTARSNGQNKVKNSFETCICSPKNGFNKNCDGVLCGNLLDKQEIKCEGGEALNSSSEIQDDNIKEERSPENTCDDAILSGETFCRDLNSKEKIVIKLVRSGKKVKKKRKKGKEKNHFIVMSSPKSNYQNELVKFLKKVSSDGDSDDKSSLASKHCDETFDEYSDAMWKMSYLSPISSGSSTSKSPPRSWSPSDPKRLVCSLDANNFEIHSRCKEASPEYSQRTLNENSACDDVSVTSEKLAALKSRTVPNSHGHLTEINACKEKCNNEQTRRKENRIFNPLLIEEKSESLLLVPLQALEKQGKVCSPSDTTSKQRTKIYNMPAEEIEESKMKKDLDKTQNVLVVDMSIEENCAPNMVLSPIPEEIKTQAKLIKTQHTFLEEIKASGNLPRSITNYEKTTYEPLNMSLELDTLRESKDELLGLDDKTVSFNSSQLLNKSDLCVDTVNKQDNKFLTPASTSISENLANESLSLASRDVYSFYDMESSGFESKNDSISQPVVDGPQSLQIVITPALYPPSYTEILAEPPSQKDKTTIQSLPAVACEKNELDGQLENKTLSTESENIVTKPVQQLKELSLFQLHTKSSVFTPPKAKDVLSPLGPHRLNRTISVEVHHENEEHHHLTVMSLEIHVETRNALRPDPKHDPVNAVFFSIGNDSDKDSGDVEGAILVDSFGNMKCTDLKNCRIWIVKSELGLFHQLIDFLKRWDPDILCGYEAKMQSWGYLLDRAHQIEESLVSQFSRVPADVVRKKPVDQPLSQESRLESEYLTEIDVKGRIVLNLWKIMRNEVALNVYSFENLAFHALHQRFPVFSFKTLTEWFKHPLTRWRVVDYYMIRVTGNLQLLDHFNVVQRTSEFARIFGIQFFEVFSRGSQFRVESMMLRMTKALGYVPVSPGIHQRARSRAPECLQLILEPESKFYKDPVVVLDFQSLYPSIIIAYNYCYSTCLGRLEHMDKKGPFDFGCVTLEVPPLLLKKFHKNVTISPNGVLFVGSSVRQGVLPKMLEEILSTRLMVKKAMKDFKDDRSLKKRLDAQQMGLKLISNVTYGYTSANYSGRMPCVELGDSIVAKARETLERAIHLVESRTDWDARVVYGDTDSMFIHLPGRSREEAFAIGQEIADVVTAANPKPVKLKFEKVYQPCLLQTKKRYVGFMYETLNQKEPVLDAKGIETIRRDNCPAVKKILEQSIRILFTTHNTLLVKRHVQRQFQKILTNRINLQEFVFAKEYRGRSGYRPNACVPALEIAKRLTQNDPRAEPQSGERVPYVIVYGAPGLPLIKLVRQPLELLSDPALKINAQYYITRVIIPPLQRVFSLLSEKVHLWFSEMPRLKDTTVPRPLATANQKGSLTQYFASANCASCNEPSLSALCSKCRASPHATAVILAEKARCAEREVANLKKICCSCSGFSRDVESCVSSDCPILFRSSQAQRDNRNSACLRQIVSELAEEKR